MNQGGAIEFATFIEDAMYDFATRHVAPDGAPASRWMKYLDGFSWALFGGGKTPEVRVIRLRRPNRQVACAYTGMTAQRNGRGCRPQTRRIGSCGAWADDMT